MNYLVAKFFLICFVVSVTSTTVTNSSDINFCLDGQTSKGMTAQQQLEAFIKGPCSPVMIVPGIEGSRLRVQIDCPLLQKSNPQIMQTCKWTNCNYGQTGAPKREYDLWLPEPFSDVFPADNSSQYCFSEMIQMDFNATGSNKFTSKQGVNITWYGNTPGSYNSSHCGSEAIQNLDPAHVNTGCLSYFAPMQSYFAKMGYQYGLSLQAVPYDWRFSVMDSDVAHNFLRVLQYLNNLTGKKVVIVAHSMGTMNTLYALNNLVTFQQKQELVQEYVPIAPCYVGATEAISMGIGGIASLHYGKLGLTYIPAMITTAFLESSYTLLPKDTWFKLAGQPFMKDVLTRVQNEKAHPPTTSAGQSWWQSANASEVGMTYFPTANHVCVSQITERKDPYCMTFLSNFTEVPVSIVEGQSFTSSVQDTIDLLNSYYYDPEAATKYEYAAEYDTLDLLSNPQVPVTFLYGAHLEADETFVFDENPKIVAEEADNFYLPNETLTINGDGTVPIYSSLLGPSKWSYEFVNNHNSTYKPVKIAEYCSTYNNSLFPYDQTDSNGVWETTTNGYIGYGCDCNPSSGQASGASCNHCGIVTDTHSILLIANILKSNKRANPNSTEFANLTSQDIINLQEQCPQLTSPPEIQDPKHFFASVKNNNVTNIEIKLIQVY